MGCDSDCVRIAQVFPLNGNVQLLLQPAEQCTEYAYWCVAAPVPLPPCICIHVGGTLGTLRRDLITVFVDNLRGQMAPARGLAAQLPGQRRARADPEAGRGGDQAPASQRLRLEDNDLVLDVRSVGRRVRNERITPRCAVDLLHSISVCALPRPPSRSASVAPVSAAAPEPPAASNGHAAADSVSMLLATSSCVPHDVCLEELMSSRQPARHAQAPCKLPTRLDNGLIRIRLRLPCRRTGPGHATQSDISRRTCWSGCRLRVSTCPGALRAHTVHPAALPVRRLPLATLAAPLHVTQNRTNEDRVFPALLGSVSRHRQPCAHAHARAPRQADFSLIVYACAPPLPVYEFANRPRLAVTDIAIGVLNCAAVDDPREGVDLRTFLRVRCIMRVRPTSTLNAPATRPATARKIVAHSTPRVVDATAGL